MKLPGATVTRIKEELGRLHRNMSTNTIASFRSSYSVDGASRSYGDDHRAIEDFVEVLLNEILLGPHARVVSVPQVEVERRQNRRHTGTLGQVEDIAHELCRENGVGALTGTMGEDA